MNKQTEKPVRLVYLIGTYPELTNTFIDREIATLRESGNFIIRIMSIRYPHTISSCSHVQKALCDETLYLIPRRWYQFNFLAFIIAHLFFVFFRPKVYFNTLIFLLTHSRAGLRAWTMTIMYFCQGVFAAYLLRNTEFEHLHVHFMDRAVLVALVISRFLGKSYSFTAHAADIYTMATHVREKIDQAYFMITVSKFNKQYLVNTYPGIDESKIHILHPWVDSVLFSPLEKRPIHDRFHILSVGRLVEKKAHKDIVEAAYLLREKGIDAEVQIVGDGPLLANLEEQIAQFTLQDRVILLGGLPQENVLSLLREWADVFVLPCVIAGNGDRDGIPVSLAEAMAMEIPVISTDIVGIGELVQQGTGILVPPHEPAALAEALAEIAGLDQSAAISMGRKGREVVDWEFNLRKGTQELAGYFYQAVGRGSPERKE